MEAKTLDAGSVRAAVYVSASNWAPLTCAEVSLAEQSRRCREVIEAYPELKRCATYRNRYESGGSGDYERLLEDAINRRFDCLVICGANHMGPTERCAFFQIGRVLLPAGFRVIDVSEGWDAQGWDGEGETGKAYANHISGMAKAERHAERRAANG